ncbi:MAG: alpha/beta fold hydrolase [Flavobacteriales bacterium]
MLLCPEKICHSKENILFLHGFLEDSITWDVYKPYFSNYNIYTYDFPGHGNHIKTDINPLNFDSIGSHIIDLLSQQNLKNIHVCSHSMGGYFALLLKKMEPSLVRKVILTNTIISSEQTDLHQIKKRERIQFLINNRFDLFCKMAFSPYYSYFPTHSILFDQKIERALKFDVSILLVLQKIISQRPDQWDIYYKYQKDMCYIVSEKDENIPWITDFERLLPEAHLLLDEYHTLPIHNPEKWINIILNHLK